jgi:hypothetical protein
MLVSADHLVYLSLSTSMPLPHPKFAEKQQAERPKRWEMMEVRFQGDGASSNGVELFEVRRA